MNTKNIQKKQPRKDWHRADIKAALEKAGWSLRKLSQAHGYSPNAMIIPLHRPWPKAEAIIAAAIGVQPEEIWPTRYAKRSTRQRKLKEAA